MGHPLFDPVKTRNEMKCGEFRSEISRGFAAFISVISLVISLQLMQKEGQFVAHADADQLAA